jgi:predicted MFS family arabinose efflux permease
MVQAAVETQRPAAGSSAPGPAGGGASDGADAGFVALTAAAFLVSLDRAIFAPLLPAIARDLHSTIGAAGLAVTAYTIPYGVCQLFYGPAADRAGKIAVVRWAVLVFAAGTALCGLAPALSVLDALRAATGGAAAAVIPLALAYIGDVVVYERRQQTIATLMGVTSLGSALSTAVGGVVGNFLTWRALFWFYGVCSLLITAVLFRVPQRPAASAEASPVTSTAANESTQGLVPSAAKRERRGDRWGWHRYSRVLADRRAQLLYVLVGLEGVFIQGGFTYLGAYLQDRFGLDYLRIGLLLACYGIGTVLASRLLRRLHGHVGERTLILVGGMLFVLGFFSLAPLPDWRLFPLAAFGMGVGFSFFHSTLQVRATELVPSLRGTSVALFAFALFLGAGLGTATLGWLVTVAGYIPLVLTCAIGMLVVTVATTLAPFAPTVAQRD